MHRVTATFATIIVVVLLVGATEALAPPFRSTFTLANRAVRFPCHVGDLPRGKCWRAAPRRHLDVAVDSTPKSALFLSGTVTSEEQPQSFEKADASVNSTSISNGVNGDTVPPPNVPPLKATAIPTKERGFFGKLSDAMPPGKEMKKLVPLGLMLFCILFNYTILRDTKDVLMVTAPKSGAEVIPFLKTYVSLPSAIAVTAVYAKLSDRMEQRDVFYTIVTAFLSYFSLFALVIYPNNAVLHPHAFIDFVASKLPQSFGAPLAIIRNWSFAMFYVMAEMWGSVVASLLFWGFANEVTSVSEAKKYYPLFGMGTNVALIFSGQFVKWVAKLRQNLAPGIDAWGLSLKYLMGAVVGNGAFLLGIRVLMQRLVLTDPQCFNAAKRTPKKKKPKVKMTLGESARFLLNSKYIRNLATLVVSYGICINIVEVSWKSKLKQAFPNPNDYAAFMGNFSSATGVVTLIMMLLGRSIFEKFGWRIAALVTPTMIGVTGLVFFCLTLFSSSVAPVAAALGTTPLMLAVLVGTVQNILSKGSKYALFDPCKEMAYIPLDQESKTKGKAAVDVVGNPLGKSGGAMIQQLLIFAVGSLAAATPYLACILAVVVFSWYRAANSLATQFEEAMSAENLED